MPPACAMFLGNLELAARLDLDTRARPQPKENLVLFPRKQLGIVLGLSSSRFDLGGRCLCCGELR